MTANTLHPAAEPSATFTLRLPERLIADLRAVAQANDRSAAGEARRALAAHCEREREQSS